MEFCNVRSLFPKLNFVSSYLTANSHVGLLFFTESWLTTKITDSMVNIDGFSILRSDRSRSKGGGVALYFKNHFEIKRVYHNLEYTHFFENFEYLCVDYFDGPNPVRFFCCYLPPIYANCSGTIKSLCQVICNLNHDCNKPCFLIGDFNQPNINWEIPSLIDGMNNDLFLQFCINNNWTQKISEPTNSKNILDLLLCNYNAINILKSYTVAAPLTTSCDHNLISFSLSTSFPIHSQSHKPHYPDFKTADFNKINDHLTKVDWTPTYNGNYQEYYDNFIGILNDTINSHIPVITPKKRPLKLPLHLKQLLSEKLSAYKKFKADSSLKSEYVKKSKEYEREVSKWNDVKENNICQNPCSKKFYNFINKKLKVKSSIPSLIKNDITASSDLEKASLLNSAFHEVFTKDDGKFSCHTRITKHLMPDFSISAEDINSAIASMKDKITRTPEGIPAYFVKRTASTLLEPLLYLFNRCLIYAFVPQQWKIGVIVPVFKKGDRSNCKNYRPISLTSTFSRIFEIIICQKITAYLLDHSLLSESQFGFLPGRSSCQQMLICIHEWLISVCGGLQMNVVYTDIAKAFDTVSHKKLIIVLLSYGINPCITSWLSSFLNHRKQCVSIGSTLSSFLPVSSGIPQGSVIGPLLFLIYFDSIASSVTPSYGQRGLMLFADDAKLYDNDSSTLQLSLNNFTSWLDNYQLKIAPNKCFSLNLSSPYLSLTPSSFLINNQPIGNKPLIKDLGIFISCDLRWSDHVSYICRNASFSSYQIIKCFKTKNINILIKLYKTYVRPKLEYNSSVWSPYLLKDKKKIESIQKHFTKYAFNRCNISFDSYSDRLSKINLKTLEHRRLICDMIMLFKITNNLSFIKFSDYFYFFNSSYNLRRNSLQIKHKHDYKIKYQDSLWYNSFFNRIVKVWNALPDYVVTSKSLETFKRHINAVDLSNHLSKF